MKEVKAFSTWDGKLFWSGPLAAHHERKLRIEKFLEENEMGPKRCGMQVHDHVVQVLIAKREELIKMLQEGDELDA